MLSLLPDTPGRGRSRFSKVLPEPPRAASQPRKALSPTSNSRNSPLPPLPNSPLPPLPKDNMAATITRRPVGNVQAAVKNWQTSTSPDMSSSYSASPSNNLVVEVLVGLELELASSPLDF